MCQSIDDAIKVAKHRRVCGRHSFDGWLYGLQCKAQLMALREHGLCGWKQGTAKTFQQFGRGVGLQFGPRQAVDGQQGLSA
jgi:hypothetical protein